MLDFDDPLPTDTDSIGKLLLIQSQTPTLLAAFDDKQFVVVRRHYMTSAFDDKRKPDKAGLT